jgi:hypothetical protein
LALLVGVPLALGVAGALEALQRHPWEAMFTSVGLIGLGVVVVAGTPEAITPVAVFVVVGLVLIGGAVYRGRAEWRG